MVEIPIEDLKVIEMTVEMMVDYWTVVEMTVEMMTVEMTVEIPVEIPVEFAPVVAPPPFRHTWHIHSDNHRTNLIYMNLELRRGSSLHPLSHPYLYNKLN